MLKNNRLSKFISKLLLAGALTLIPAGYTPCCDEMMREVLRLEREVFGCDRNFGIS